MPHERERERKIKAIDVQLGCQAKRIGIVLAVVALLSTLVLALLLAQVSGILELPDYS